MVRLVLVLSIVILLTSMVLASDVDQELDRLLEKYRNPTVETKDQVDQLRQMANYPFDEVVPRKDWGKHADVNERVDWYIKPGIDQIIANKERIDKVQTIYAMASRYIEFVDNGKLVCFATSRDEAVVALRDCVGLPAPKGFAYVQTGAPIKDEYRTTESDGSKAMGVTIDKRFIIIEAQISISENGAAVNDNGKVLSHELTHAYVNCLIGEDSENLPKWFKEGLAISLSGTEIKTLVETTGTVERYQILSQEYTRYFKMFKYLRHVKGRGKFIQFIREAVNDRSTSKALVSLLGYEPSEEGLYKSAKKWESGVNLFYTAEVIWTLCGVWIVIMAGRLRWKRKYSGYLVRPYVESVTDLETAERVLPPQPKEIWLFILLFLLFGLSTYLLFWGWGICATLA